MSSADLTTLSWPASQAEEATLALARHSKLLQSSFKKDRSQLSVSKFKLSVPRMAMTIGIEAEEVETTYREINSLIRKASPAIIQIQFDGEPRLLLLLPGPSRRPRVLTRHLKAASLPKDELHSTLVGPLEATVAKKVETILESVPIRQRRQESTRRALFEHFLADKAVGRVWLLRLPASAPFFHQLRQIGTVDRILVLVGTHVTQYFFLLLSWWLIGRGALNGSFDRGWTLGWALLLFTIVPLRMLVASLRGRIVIETGALFKRRLLAGVMNLDLESLKSEGIGMALGRVLESDAIEAQALSGGSTALLALVEIIMTMWVLCQGAGGLWHGALYGSWLCFTAYLFYRYIQANVYWITLRQKITNDLTERMIGHRTRLVQEHPEHWHLGEDQLLDNYLSAAKHLDTTGGHISHVGLGWRIVGVASLASFYAASPETSVETLAISLGGIILGSRALQRMASGVPPLSVAGIAWKRAKAVFQAASKAETSSSLPSPNEKDGATLEPIIVARDLSFHHRDRGRAALSRINLKLNCGDQALLVGPSGGGKSTLISIMGALREPDSGLILCQGLDLPTLGSESWRKAIAIAPQFHENHILSETFAFNLLMGRDWPPSASDYRDAREICLELGLGDLLHRMPGGMLQVIGESGWQLSHGEQSRLFVARALLQRADLVILDESFGALDSENLLLAIGCARKRAKSLLVVAHP